jgi:hypothetical protein
MAFLHLQKAIIPCQKKKAAMIQV